MGLDDAFLCTRLDALRVGSLTQQQSDGTQYDALASARLTSENGKTFSKGDVYILNDCEVCDG
jgi:hypothetical protein